MARTKNVPRGTPISLVRSAPPVRTLPLRADERMPDLSSIVRSRRRSVLRPRGPGNRVLRGPLAALGNKIYKVPKAPRQAPAAKQRRPAKAKAAKAAKAPAAKPRVPTRYYDKKVIKDGFRKPQLYGYVYRPTNRIYQNNPLNRRRNRVGDKIERVTLSKILS